MQLLKIRPQTGNSMSKRSFYLQYKQVTKGGSQGHFLYPCLRNQYLKKDTLFSPKPMGTGHIQHLLLWWEKWVPFHKSLCLFNMWSRFYQTWLQGLSFCLFLLCCHACRYNLTTKMDLGETCHEHINFKICGIIQFVLQGLRKNLRKWNGKEKMALH